MGEVIRESRVRGLTFDRSRDTKGKVLALFQLLEECYKRYKTMRAKRKENYK